MRPKYGLFQTIVIFLSSVVAKQHRKARGDLIALLHYVFLNLRYTKHIISDVLVYIYDNFNFFPLYHEEKWNFNNFRGHVELGWANQILLELNQSFEQCYATACMLSY